MSYFTSFTKVWLTSIFNPILIPNEEIQKITNIKSKSRTEEPNQYITLEELFKEVLTSLDFKGITIVCVGGQSVGKTLLFKFIIFHFLKNKLVTEDMKNTIHELFRVGIGMTTSRVTNLILHDCKEENPKMTISFQGETYSHNDPKFKSTLNEIKLQSQMNDGIAHNDDVKISLYCNGMINTDIIDLIGLTVVPKQLINSGETDAIQTTNVEMSILYTNKENVIGIKAVTS